MEDLISSLERELATLLISDRNAFSRTTQTASSMDIVLAIREYQQNIERYQQNMEALTRILSRAMQHERANVTRANNAFTNSRIFTFYQGDTPPEPQLTPAQIREETATILYDASSAQHHVCPISLDDFVQGEVITQIRGCGHTFKTDYLMRWLERKVYCPVCRYNLLDHSYNDVGDEDIPNPVMTGDYEVVPPSETQDHSNPTLETQFTFEIPLLYDTSNNHLVNPNNGERTTTRQMQSHIMRELLRGFRSGGR